MNFTRFKFVFVFLFCFVVSAVAYSQDIDPSRDIKWPTGVAGCAYIPGTNTCATVAGGGGANGVVDTTGGTYADACGLVLEERAAGTTTINLPAGATGCNGVISRGVSAGLITIAPPGGVSYDGVTTQLPQGQSLGWWYDGTGYHSTRPIIPGSHATYTPSLTGNIIDFAGSGSGGSVCPTASSLGFSLSGSDETSTLNTLLSASQTAGTAFCMAIDAGKTLTLNSAEITLPNNGGGTPTQIPIRITGTLASSNGTWSTLPTGSSTINMTFNATHAKIVTLGIGTLELDHILLKDSGSDCAPFVLTTNTSVHIHDVAFSGTASGTSACNDAIVLGGTTTTVGGTTTSAFQGYGSYIQHNFFDKIRRATYFRVYAQGVTFKDNTISATCGATSSEAAIHVGTGTGTTDGNVFSGNLFETSHYPYVYWFAGANNNIVTGDTFWDSSVTTLFAFHFTGGAQLNTAYVSADATFSSTNLTDNNEPAGPNTVMDQKWQSGIGVAASDSRICTGSGSGTVQTCGTFVPFTMGSGTKIRYITTTANSGTGLTIDVNGLGAKSVAIPSASGYTTTLVASPASIPALTYIEMVYNSNSNHLEVVQNGVLPSAGALAGVLTMDNSGSGDASGATFNGSVAKKISYNTIGADCALTLTTTGTSGAATLGACSGGTHALNIPQYSGGSGGAVSNISGSVTPSSGTTCTAGSCSFSAQAAVTLSSIAGTGNHLNLTCLLKTSALVAVKLTLNSDTLSTSYANEGQEIQNTNTTATSVGQISQTGIYLGAFGTLAGQTTIDIPFYAVTTIPRIVNVKSGSFTSQSSNTNNFFDPIQGLWNNTSSAVSSLTLTPTTGNTITGSCSIYLIN